MQVKDLKNVTALQICQETKEISVKRDAKYYRKKSELTYKKTDLQKNPSRAKQSMKDEVDINNILKKVSTNWYCDSCAKRRSKSR